MSLASRPYRSRTVAAFVGATFVLTIVAASAESPSKDAAAQEIVSFNEHIRPIFAEHCMKCHGFKAAGGLSLVYHDQVLAGGESGLEAIVPHHPDESYLLDRVSDSDPETRMPPGDHGRSLTPEEIAVLTRWVEQGAPWGEPWAFVPPRSTTPPPVSDESWPRDPLDRYILAQLDEAELAPAAPAPKPAWLRRVTLDLTGLPPTPEEYEAFAQDASGDAPAHVVDRLLASSRSGERWAAMWLDLARYADTMGFEKDPHREIWPYRDWVIRALNDDMPFDQFTIKQLAGDLLPDATLEDRLATAFHRNTQTNTEGGTDDEEFRTAAVIDRVSTTWQTWQSLTFGCTQCHDHPYEPIRNEEFYQFAAIFNNTRDADVNEELPLLNVPTDPDQWEEAQELDSRIAEIRQQLHQHRWPLAAEESTWRRVAATTLSATGETRLVTHTDPTDQVVEVHTAGTVSAQGTFTIEFDLPQIERLTAIRIEALPRQLAEALKVPESGFVLSSLSAKLVKQDAAEEAPLALAFCDEAAPLLDPQESLNKNDLGWAQYTKIDRPRTGVFVLKEAAAVAPGARLQLELRFLRTDSGGGALAIRRGRFSVSGDERYLALGENPELLELQRQLRAAKKRRGELTSVAVPVMADNPGEFARRSYTFVRGNWLDKDAEVTPGLPAVMPPPAEGETPDRLAMARWLVSGKNPLTARVVVNRLWQELFGVGLVETAEDFGTSGAQPSHPELLDHLALRLQNDHAWSLKKTLRDIVLSATYAQDNATTPEKLAVDPRNRLLSRGPRTRLTAEMVRDQALAVSGALSAKMYGPPVMPPQPDGIWRSAYNGAVWKAAEGEDRFRRAVYTYCKRTSGYPAFLTFDMPSRDVCTARRIATNTPLQALVTLNDEAFIELAQAFAARMAAAGDEPSEQIAAGYQLAVGQEISPRRLERLEQLYDEATAAYTSDDEAARPLADTPQRYGLTIVASAILNLDEVLTK